MRKKGKCPWRRNVYGPGGWLERERRAHYAHQAGEGRGTEKSGLIDELRLMGITDARVLAALAKVPRERFLPPDYRMLAGCNRPLPIGHGQTISQPYIVALMTELLDLQGGEKVLEVGTGSGYQTAILAELAGEVLTVEVVAPLAALARETLSELGYGNIRYRLGDGWEGWPDEAPFDGVIVTAAPDCIPETLVEQLTDGGRLIVPVGPPGEPQTLLRVWKRAGEVEVEDHGGVVFVPMVRGGSNN
ncbi:MAG: protein-L-isoaspartate(D-aspartate) O-methyltransferase [Patescibacteria group bacterium]